MKTFRVIAMLALMPLAIHAQEQNVRIADGSDKNAGKSTDPAVSGDVSGTLAAKVRNLNKIITLVWDSGDNKIKVTFDLPISVTGPLTDAQLRASAVPVSATQLPGALAGGGGLKVECLSGCGGSASFADNAAFTFGTTSIGNMGAVVDDASTNAVTENSAGSPRMSGNRILYGNLRSSSGTEVVTATTTPGGSDLGLVTRNIPSGTQTVSGTFWQATQPVSGTVTANAGTGTFTVSGTVTANAGTNLNTSALALDATQTNRTQKTQITDGTRDGTLKAASTLPLATDTAVVVTQRDALPAGANVIGHVIADSGSTTVVTGSVAVTNSGLTNLDATTQTVSNGTAGTKSQLIGGVFNTTPPTLTNGQGSALQSNAKGELIVSQPSAADLNATVTGTVAATQSGTWTVQPGNTANTTAWKVDGSAVTQPVSGTVTANAGTNLNTSALALDATLTGGTQKAIARGGAKGATAAADVTSTANGADHQGLDVQVQNASIAVTGTVTTTPPANASTNVTQLAGTAVEVNSGNKSAGTLRMVLATDQPQLTNALKVDGSAVTQPVSGTVTANAGTGNFTVTQGTGTNLHIVCDSGCGVASSFADNAAFTFGTTAINNMGAVVDDVATNSVTENSSGAPRMSGSRILYVDVSKTAANATAIKVDNSAVTQPVSGTVTTSPPANASTNVAQLAGTTTSVNSGTKDAGTLRVVLATDQPALTNKLLVTPDSVALPANQSVNVAQFGGTNTVTGGVAGIIAVGGNVANAVTATANPVPVGGVFTTTPTTLTTGQTATLQFTAAQNLKHDLTTVAGTAADTNSGSKSAGTLRVVIATDQPALTNKLLVTPDSVALPANQSVNTAQFGGTNVSTGTGAGGAGIPRVTISNDSSLAANQSVNVAQIGGTNTVTAAAGVQKVGIVGNANGAFDAANNAAAPANVLATGLEVVAQGTQPTAATSLNVRRQIASTEGVAFVQEGNSNRFSCFVASTATVTTQCQAAPGAGLRAYVTSVTITNAVGTAQSVDVVFGTGAACVTGITALTNKFFFVGATQQGSLNASVSFTTPLVPTAANAICLRPTAATAFGGTITGYIAP